MPSPRTTSKDQPAKRSSATVGAGAAGTTRSRNKAAATAAATTPPVAAEPAPKPEKKVTVSLIDAKVKPATPAAEAPKRRALPPISRIKAAVPVAPEPPPVAPPPAPEPPPKPAPAPPVLDLISSATPASRAAAASAAAAAAAAEIPAAPETLTPAAAPASEVEAAPAEEKILHIKPPILVKDLAVHLGLKLHQLNRDLIAMDIFASPSQVLEQEIVSILCKKHGFVLEVERREKGGGVHKQETVVAAPPPPVIENPEEELKTRAPIITFMGHVDHGKTSLMDAIRKTKVTAGEAGGITQHIGAYSVDRAGQKITFLDTPGHAAFTAMRARGANVTDIAVIVIAADDGLMPQTIEAINHAKAAPHVKIMVALNKIDVTGANPDRVKKQLQDNGLTPDDWGGETTVCPVSATKGTGIDHLIEMMLLQSELLDLRASPTAAPRGTVIEAQLEAGRGPTATVIVQMGTLKTGDAFICGKFAGKVKALFDDQGKSLKSAGPSTPVKVVGFAGLPSSGDEFLVMDNERSAKTLSEERLLDLRNKKLVAPRRATLESLFHAADAHKEMRLILKTDVQGSLEAIVTSLGQIESKKINVDFIHTGVGPISESDVLLASASNAVIIGFNTKVENVASPVAKREGVDIKLYSIIYELLDQVKEAMVGMLDPELRETIIGHAEVKQVFDLTKGKVAGCMVIDGRVARTARARLLRRRQPIYDGGLATLRRFQDEVKEVRAGVECGIKLGDYSDYQVEDVIECYLLDKIAQKL